MKPIIQTFYEGEKFSQELLKDRFPASDILTLLIQNGILRAERNGEWRIDFVGVAAFGKHTFQFLPKFFKSCCEKEIRDYMSLIIKVLRKYSYLLPPQHDDARHLKVIVNKQYISHIALADWFIRDYLRNGLYNRIESKYEKNGRGDINWRRTVNQSSAYFSAGSTIYLDLITRKSTSDPVYLVARLHRYVVEESLKLYGHLLGYSPIRLDHETIKPISEVPSSSMVLRLLERELQQVYSENSIRLLKRLKAWFGEEAQSHSHRLTLFGVNSFHTVWEAVCSYLFRNEYLSWKSFIPKPLWSSKEGDWEQPANSLIPDIIKPCRIGTELDHLLVLDAKYYNLQMPPKLSGFPGIGDVTKQLNYEQVLQDSVLKFGFKDIINCFLFPSLEGELLSCNGEVSLEGIDAGPVIILYLNAFQAFRRYIFQDTFTDSEFLTYFKRLA